MEMVITNTSTRSRVLGGFDIQAGQTKNIPKDVGWFSVSPAEDGAKYDINYGDGTKNEDVDQPYDTPCVAPINSANPLELLSITAKGGKVHVSYLL